MHNLKENSNRKQNFKRFHKLSKLFDNFLEHFYQVYQAQEYSKMVQRVSLTKTEGSKHEETEFDQFKKVESYQARDHVFRQIFSLFKSFFTETGKNIIYQRSPRK